MPSYVIIGGTGKVGRRLTRLLLEQGHDARPVSRRTEIPFDWHDRSTWAPALSGATGIFIVGPGSATDWSPTLTRLLQTAQAAGVRHSVLLSARGVEFLPTGAVAAAEKALQAGPLAWTILRPSHFTQNFTEAMFVPIDGRITAPVGNGAEPFIDVQDIAEVAAAVLTGRRYDHRILSLSGPAALTFAEAAAVVGAVFRTETEDEHSAKLRAAKIPEGYVIWRMAMLRGIRTGADAYLSDGVSEVLGRPALPFHP
jgi:uncharacterized protein YbjT (DUF2867 family)